LRNELERDSKVAEFNTQIFIFLFFQIIVPLLPGKALKRQLPFRNDDGIFDETFIEERRKGLEQFLNKVAGYFVKYFNFLIKYLTVIHWRKMKNLYIFFSK